MGKDDMSDRTTAEETGVALERLGVRLAGLRGFL